MQRVLGQPRAGANPARAAAALVALVVVASAAPALGAGEPRRPASGPKDSSGSPTNLRSLAPDQVNHDLSFQEGSEASSAIAVEIDDPDRVIAASNDAGSPPQAFVSNEGLAAGSVGRRFLPSAALAPGGAQTTVSPCCDPAVTADANGNLWMAVATSAGAGPIALGRIAAGTTNFGSLTAALPTAPAATAAEKPALAVLSDEVIAATWVETAGGARRVAYSECDLSAEVADCDDPGNWSAPVAVTGGGGGPYSMPAIDLSPSGDVYLTWWDAGADNAIELDRCKTGEDCTVGASWNEDAAVAGLDAFDDDGAGGADPLPLRCPIIGAPGGLVNPSPSVEIGPDGTVYVAYGNLRDNPDPGEPTRCSASGTDETWDVFVAAGAAPGNFPIPNGGRRLSADGPLDPNDHFLPALSVDPSSDEVEATFYTTASDPGGQRALRAYVSSSDSGLSWSTPVALADAESRFSGPLSDGIDYGERQGTDSAGGVLRTVWTDNRPLQSRDPDLYVLSPVVETSIDAGPGGAVPNAISSFSFSTAAPRIECRIDGANFAKCISPRMVGPLANGAHNFSARGTDLAGNVMDPTPPTSFWTVADQDPPETTLTLKPKKKTKSKRPAFEFIADELGARFQCRYDTGEWRNCMPPKKGKVTVGRHKFAVHAIDVGGNIDPTPAKYKFKRKRQCSKQKRRKGKC